MSRETADDILRGFLAINAMLRDELALVRRTLARRNGERKYNPNWPSQPRAPRGAPEGGQWVDGGGISKKPPTIPKNRGGARRPGIGHNRPPPDSLKEIFPGLQHAAPSAILAPVDDFLGISRPGLAANEAATRNVADNLIADIQSNSADRTYRIPDLRVDRVAFDMTIWRKPPSYPQIRDVFGSDFRPIAFVVVGPSQLGPGSTYVITPPAARGE